MNLTFDLLQAADLEDAVECISQTFAKSEPMLNSCRISKEEFEVFARAFIRKAVDDELSIIVKDGSRTVAAVINEDLATEAPEGIETVTPKMDPVLGILTQLQDFYQKHNSFSEGEVFHIFMGGVYKDYEGKNIAARMVEESEKLAKRKGFEKIVVEATGNASRIIFEKHPKFSEIHHIRYSDYRLGDKHVFLNIQNAEACVLFEAEL